MHALFVLMASILMFHSFITLTHKFDKSWTTLYIFFTHMYKQCGNKTCNMYAVPSIQIGAVRGKKNNFKYYKSSL